MAELRNKLDTNEISDVRCFEVNVLANKKLMREVSDSMLAYFHANDDVIALTANQFGYDCRVIGIKFEDGIKFFVNPMIVSHDAEKQVVVEADFNDPSKRYLVLRHANIELGFQDLFGLAGSVNFSDTLAYLVQQLVHFIDGVTLRDIGLEVMDDFFDASPEEQQEVVEMYCDMLKRRNEAVQEEVKSDDVMRQAVEAIDFLTAAAKGEVQIDTPKLSNRKQRVIDKLTRKFKKAGHNYTKKKKKRK